MDILQLIEKHSDRCMEVKFSAAFQDRPTQQRVEIFTYNNMGLWTENIDYSRPF